MRRRETDRAHGLFWGLAFVALGTVFLLSQFGVLPRHLLWDWWMWWPGLLIAFGIVRLVRPRDAGDVGGGVTMTLLGAWLFANYFEWWGLTWHTSWPIALMAAGAGMVTRALASRVMRDRCEPLTFDPRKEGEPHA